MGHDLLDGFSIARFQARLRDLHARARRGTLSPEERTEYEKQRTDIARMLCFAQQLTRTAAQTFRQALRVSATLPVDVERDGGGESERATTIDLSAGGFAARFGAPRSVGRSYGFVLHVGSGAQVVEGRARLVSARAGEGGSQRASFAFESLPADVIERVELAVFDVVLGEWPG